MTAVPPVLQLARRLELKPTGHYWLTYDRLLDQAVARYWQLRAERRP